MTKQAEIESKLKKLKLYLAEQFNVEQIGYFGSFVRNEQTETSDLDIIVKFSKPVGWAFFDLQTYLESTLNIKVDLVTHSALKEQLKDSILKEVKYI